ncbi:DNA replication complex GINS protein psf3 [Erysiphe necator]|uniref:DNA replication complex GINS protein PSF3 n=1 Tax=Uncinula necator TaxID=52586 RepID=A0A0B1P8V8_UNCNE|nr:DNA replication complex GINS protein psf3 [Erysiphe necator]KHJ33361.1 putative dna replication complex gins protein psf3 [Erysiphe necator]
MSYYDINAILTDAHKVPCVFDLDLPNLGYLDANPGQTLKSGTQLELPLWLAEILAVSSTSSAKSLVTLDLPSSLAPRVINALKADPTSVDLHALAPNFYGLGARILELFEEEEICNVLIQAWQTRAIEINDHARYAAANQRNGIGFGDEGLEFLRGLDEAEKELFRASHDSSKNLWNWMRERKKV